MSLVNAHLPCDGSKADRTTGDLLEFLHLRQDARDDVGPALDGCGPGTDYVAPAWASGTPTLATSGASFLAGDAWGAWEGDLVVSTLKEEDLRRFTVSDGGDVTYQQTLLDGRFGRLRAVVIGPDGALYVSTSNGNDDRVIRVTRAS